MKDAKSCTSIGEVRHEIDRIDREIMELLAKRQEYVSEIVRFKTDEESIIARDRQEQLYRQRRVWAEELNLPVALVHDIFATMVHHNIQRELDLHKQIQSR